MPPKSKLTTDTFTPPMLMTVAEVADWAHVSTKSVYRWIQTGQLPALQFGTRIYRIEPEAVRRFLRQAGYDNTAAVPDKRPA